MNMLKLSEPRSSIIDLACWPAIACSDWRPCTGSVATRPDDELDLAVIQKLLLQIVNGTDTAPNAVRYVMNRFVSAVGRYAKPLLKSAKRAARTIGAVAGDTACKVPLASACIETVEKAGRVGKKRKTVKC